MIGSMDIKANEFLFLDISKMCKIGGENWILKIDPFKSITIDW